MKLAANLVIALFFVSAGINDATGAVLRPAITVDADVAELVHDQRKTPLRKFR